MFFNVVILLIFAIAIYAGARRGVIMQGVYTVCYGLLLMLAAHFCQSIGGKIQLWVPYPSAVETSRFTFFEKSVGLSLDQAFYNGVGFILVIVAGVLVIKFLLLFVSHLTFIQFPQPYGQILGGFLSFIVSYVAIFLVLYCLALIPVSSIQQALDHSVLAKIMVLHTPVLTRFITDLWIVL